MNAPEETGLCPQNPQNPLTLYRSPCSVTLHKLSSAQGSEGAYPAPRPICVSPPAPPYLHAKLLTCDLTKHSHRQRTIAMMRSRGWPTYTCCWRSARLPNLDLFVVSSRVESLTNLINGDGSHEGRVSEECGAGVRFKVPDFELCVGAT